MESLFSKVAGLQFVYFAKIRTLSQVLSVDLVPALEIFLCIVIIYESSGLYYMLQISVCNKMVLHE